jgi:hypothetical protein
MRSVAKTLLALALAMGFLALDAKAQTKTKATVAFLGIDPATDPLFGRALSGLIHQDLAADTGLASLPAKAVDDFLRKASFDRPEAGPGDIARLKLGLEAKYYAFGRLQELVVENKRVWWMPWTVKTKWTRTLRMRVVDGGTGETVFDGVVPAEIPEKHFMKGPKADFSRQGAVERDHKYRRMLPFLSAEAAKALSRIVAEKSAGPASAQAGDAPADASASAK